MKLLYLANIRFPTEKAHSVQIMNMCTSFARAGTHVTLAPSSRATPITEDPFYYYGMPKLFSIVRVPCMDAIRFGPLGFFLQTFTFTLGAIMVAFKQKPDVVYGRDEWVLWALSPFFSVVWETHVGVNNFASRRLIKKKVKIVGLTTGHKEFYERLGAQGARFLVAHDAVDPARFLPSAIDHSIRGHLDIAEDAVVIGYVGKYKTMGEGKGVEEIVKSFADVSSRYPQAHLLIVGLEKKEVSEIVALAKVANLSEDRYTFVTHVLSRQVPSYVSVADILVMNFPNIAHYARFMSPLKLFEYMAAGKAIITTDLPSIREVLDDTQALFVPPSDNNALARAMQKLFTDPELRNRMGAKAKKISEHFTWDERAKNILNFIRS